MPLNKEIWEMTRWEYITKCLADPKGRTRQLSIIRRMLAQEHYKEVCWATQNGKPTTAEIRKSAKLPCFRCTGEPTRPGLTGFCPAAGFVGPCKPYSWQVYIDQQRKAQLQWKAPNKSRPPQGAALRGS